MREPSPFRVGWNPPWSELPGMSAVISSGRADDYHVEAYRTTFSLKSVRAGRADYRTRTARYLVTPDRFLLLNHGQEYGMDLDARDRTETFCLFFAPGFLEDVADALASPAERLIDHPEPAGGAFGAIERMHPMTGPLAAHLWALLGAARSPARKEELLVDGLYACAADIVKLEQRIRREVATFPALRLSTREELYRRLYRARDYIESCFAEPLTVAELARVACLSHYHFHRMFKLAFHQTPMAALRERRLAEAQRLLSQKDAEVTKVALAVGFQSLGSFSALFHRRVGVSPAQFRAGAGARALRRG